jgi:hypothetical protein
MIILSEIKELNITIEFLGFFATSSNKIFLHVPLALYLLDDYVASRSQNHHPPIPELLGDFQALWCFRDEHFVCWIWIGKLQLHHILEI